MCVMGAGLSVILEQSLWDAVMLGASCHWHAPSGLQRDFPVSLGTRLNVEDTSAMPHSWKWGLIWAMAWILQRGGASSHGHSLVST